MSDLTPNILRFGTRGSDLALWQTKHVMALLKHTLPDLQVEYEIIKTRGDQVLDTPLPLVGGKGVFTAELESALYDKRIDAAVHSLKDLPTDQPAGLSIAAILQRTNPADVLISRKGYTLNTLPKGAKIGTSSYRRSAQLLLKRPDLKMLDIRGNIDTRIRKALAADSEYDAIVLAYAGLERIGQTQVINQALDLDDMLPAPGQGAIAVQTRNEAAILRVMGLIHHLETAIAVTAERAFLAGLGGGCSVPVAAYAHWEADQLILRGRVCSQDGAQRVEINTSGHANDVNAAYALGTSLAHEALEKGVRALMSSTI